MLHLFLLSAVMLPAAEEQACVAMVLRVKGSVIRYSGGEKPSPWEVMDLLRAGDRLTLPPGSEATVVFAHDGHKEVLRPDSKVSVGKQGCVPGQAVSRREGSRLSEAALSRL